MMKNWLPAESGIIERVHLAMSYAPRDAEITELRVEYKKQARPGDTITPQVCVDEARTVISLNTDEPACVVELS